MSKKIIAFVFALLSAVVYGYSPAVSAEKDLTANAADYIIAKAREGKKNRLAVYAFTNEAGEASSEAKGCSTKIMALILDKKEFKVIDPERVPEIINEQEKGLTGLVDPETAAETGKMIGADALVFGISGSDSLQVRIIDAATGEVIGATIQQNGSKTKISNEEFKSPEGKKRFIAAEFERTLHQIYTKHPMLYLYITANDAELSELNETLPGAMKKFNDRIAEKDPVEKSRFEKRKKRLLDFRNENPGFDNRLQESRRSLLEQFKEKKGKKKRK